MRRSGILSTIKYDIEHGNLQIFDPRLTPEIVEELDEGADVGGICYPEWFKAKLVLLPKKGDLGLPKNWRGVLFIFIVAAAMETMEWPVPNLCSALLRRTIAYTGSAQTGSEARGLSNSLRLFLLTTALCLLPLLG